MKKNPGGKWTARGAAALPWLIGGTVLASFLALVCGGYYIHATSDPFNWLGFARNFTEEFGQSRWPYGYPLYLRGMLELLGPYWVFLANLPALLGVFAVAGWIGTLFEGEDRRAPEGGGGEGLPWGWGFLAVWVVVLGADSADLLAYVNPFRDPPSYLLLLASVGVFVRSLKARRMLGVGVSGALLGLACSVREPSVLMLLPLFAYGLLAWRSGRPGLGLWRTAGAFALGMGVGVAPMLVQSYLSTHQVLVPHNLILNVPESEEESKIVPGMYFTGTRLGHVGGMAFWYYLGTEKLVLVLAAVGLAAAIRRRNRLVLAVVAPTAVGYAVFYAFYRIFVRRYFYVSVLFFALLAGYGLFSLLRLLHARMRPPLGRAAGWLLLAAVACTSSVRLLGECPDEHPQQVPQARAMADAIRGICPDASAVYAKRPLGDWIGWFLGCESGPLEQFIPGPGGTASPVAPGAVRDALAPRLEKGENLYAAFWTKDDWGMDAESDVPFVRRSVDRRLSAVFDPREYFAGSCANGTVWFYRLASWTNLATAVDWPVPERGPHGGAYWFMADLGDWPEGHAPAGFVPDGAPNPPSSAPHGGTWVGGAEAVEADTGRTVAAVVSSADPLPCAIPVRTGRLDEPLVLDFRPFGKFDHLWRWTGYNSFPTHLHRHPGVGILDSADLELPVPWPALSEVVVELELVADREVPDVAIPVSVSEDGRVLARAEVRGDRSPVRLAVPMPSAPDRESRRLHFDVEPQPAPESDDDQDPVGIECAQATIHRWPVFYPVSIRLGSSGDTIHSLTGFSRPEGRGNATFRWTQGAAGMTVYLPATDRPLLLVLAGSVGGMPAEAKADAGPDLRITWDGEVLSGRLETDDDGNDFVWRGELPPGTGDGRTPHRIGIESPTWRPADYGLRDSRTLGVRISCIDIAPAG